jgi:hypothetical protein
MVRATIAEILHAKDPLKFGQLIGYLIDRGLLDPESLGGRSQGSTRARQGSQRRRNPVVFSTGTVRSGYGTILPAA